MEDSTMIITHGNQAAAEHRRQAKDLYLKRQRAKVIDRLKGATGDERKAVIRNIDSFPAGEKQAKTFGLKVRREIERQIERGGVK
jgi:hypothetical protein